MIIMDFGEENGRNSYRCSGSKEEVEAVVEELRNRDTIQLHYMTEIIKVHKNYTIYFVLTDLSKIKRAR